MASRLPPQKAMVIFGIFVLLTFVGNAWISHELKKLEEVSVVHSSSVNPVPDVEEPAEYYGIVKIDPDNDPLAPVVNVVAQNAASRKSVPSDVSSPVYEAPLNSDILVQ